MALEIFKKYPYDNLEFYCISNPITIIILLSQSLQLLFQRVYRVRPSILPSIHQPNIQTRYQPCSQYIKIYDSLV